MTFKWDTDKMVGLSAMVVGVGSLIPGRLVPAGEWINTIGTGGAEPGRTLVKDLLHLFVVAEAPSTWLTMAGVTGPASERAVLIVTYSSVYGEKWHLRSDSFAPVPGPAAPIR